MKKKPLLITFIAGLALHLPCAAASNATHGKDPVRQARGVSVLQHSAAALQQRDLKVSKAAFNHRRLPDDGNLPEAASALPLLSAIGAGALLGGLLSARRTRSEK